MSLLLANRTAPWAAVFGLLLAGNACGDVRLPALVGDGMVLQRDAKVALWGWANPREKIRIEFHGETIRAAADRQGRWFATLGPYPAGGPFNMVVAGANRLELRDILMGDVWLASGQSNMGFQVKKLDHSPQHIGAADVPQLRLFAVRNNAAPQPKMDVSSNGWHPATPQSVGEFSAVAYLFGRELHERYRVPIGLIQSAWGGTTAETWMSAGALRQFPEFGPPIAALAQVSDKTRADYARYIQRVADWYRQQGSSDRGHLGGRNIWADPDFNASGWPTIDVPRPISACGKDFNGFTGVVWFRRTIDLPPERAGKDLMLHLGQLSIKDTVAYFNGVKVGEGMGLWRAQDYLVPGKRVNAGRNTLVVRLLGTDERSGLGCVGLFGPKISVETAGNTYSLAGRWSYQSGPELRDFPQADLATLAAQQPPSPGGPYYWPTVLFNGMIGPLAPFRIKGVVWYQGESNAIEDRSAQYRTLFPALIADWRRHWGCSFPFVFVQLAGWGANDAEPMESSWAALREAQSLALSVPATAMASAVDIGDEDDMHPRNKHEVAHRLVLAAAKAAYGEDVVHSGPMYRALQIEANRIRIKFSELGSGLLIKDRYGYARGFAIAAADGRFRWAQARQDGEDVVVFHDAITRPTAVRYDWSNTPDGNVFNREGLPAVPFRTDAPSNAPAK